MEEFMPADNKSSIAKPSSRLRELGLVLPQAPTPLGAYIEASEVGSLLFLSGMLPVVNGKLSLTGRLGENLSLEQGREAVRIAAMNALAVAQQHLGDLDRVKKLAQFALLRPL
jgi:enamine deaminase RidA (YjgF/YER057c/UK114 family)